MRKAFILLYACCGLNSVLYAQIDTAPVGFNKVTCLPSSDTHCSVPFVSKWEVKDQVSGIPSISGEQATISPQGTVSWATDQFATLYFVRMLSGAKAGMYYQIVSNTSGTLTLDLAGDDFSSVGNDDSFSVSKFWTLSTLFPPATQTTIVPSTGLGLPARNTQVLIPDVHGSGTNLATSRIFFLYGGNWRSSGTTLWNDFILLPDTYFIIHHGNSAITASTTFNSIGTVEVHPVSMPLATLTTGEQDNHTTTGRPIPLKLQDFGLLSSGAFSGTSVISGSTGDKLLIYDNTISGVNKSASKSYYYYTGSSFGGPGWRLQGGGFTSIRNQDQPFQPSSGLFIRKEASSTGSSVIWTVPWAY